MSRPADPRADRIGSLRAHLDRERVDALYVGSAANIRYLTGFTGSAGHLLITGEAAILFTDSRYEIQSAEETDGIEIVIGRRDSLQDLLEALPRRAVRRLAYERALISAALLERLADVVSRSKLVGLDDAVERLRLIKTEAEIEAIRRSVELNSAAFERVLAKIRPTWTERRTAAELDYWMQRLGASGAAFPTIVASGAHSALPHARPRDAACGSGVPVLVDQGALLAGYASDMTRVVCLGSASAELRRVYSAVRRALEAAVAAIRPGVSTRTVDWAARRSLREDGLEKLFTHSIGHGVGLEVHEQPFFRRGPGRGVRLRQGMVVTVEPGVYVAGELGVRLEDMVVVRQKGYERLTKTPLKLRIL